MALIDDLMRDREEEEDKNPSHWLMALLRQKHAKAGEGRIVRTPIGFNFNREPFDPSSYYKQLGSFRDISRAATNVVNQMVINRQEREQADLAALRGQLAGAVSGNQNWSASKSYGLKKISANTAKAADYFGSKYGIKNIGGWRSHGSVPNSDHPKGRALDYMTRNKKQGDALARDVIQNYKRWNVSYVIWYRYIWTPGRGWRRYSGPSPHTDHVHVSFLR